MGNSHNNENNNSDQDNIAGIPGMGIDKKYSLEKPILPQDQEKVQKEMEKTKKELEKLKNFIVKKYPFAISLSIIPPQAIRGFIEEEEIPKQTEKHIHLIMIIPEEKHKEIPQITEEVVKEINKTGQKIWLQIKTPVDVWDLCFDRKFDLFGAISLSMPLYDKCFLGALRLVEIHKSLVLRKFEKYVVSYVVAGSFLTGTATETSDIDVFVIINDTDVKRMSRLELKERLRGIIHSFVQEAAALAGVKNTLHLQTYLLTDFWDSVKDAYPVIFTFIRDGVPIHDRGTFMPWKALLKMGRLRPSPEALDMFMSIGDKATKRAKAMLLDIVVQDIFHAVSSPSQAILMLYGLPPTNVYETVKEMKKIFVDKEKMLEKKYTDILEEIMIKYYKGWEHEKIKEVSGKEVDRLLKNTEDYLKRLNELRQQIEKQAQEKTIEQIYNDVFELLKSILGKKSQEKIIQDFENSLVKKGKFPLQDLRILRDIVAAKKEFKMGKSDLHKIDRARKNAAILINDLIEYTQRCDLISLERGRMKIKFKKDGKEQIAEILNADGKTFLLSEGNAVKKITNNIENSNTQEVSEAVEKQKANKKISIYPKVFEVLKKELGDFAIIL